MATTNPRVTGIPDGSTASASSIAVDRVNRATPASADSPRWRVSRGPTSWDRVIDHAVPLVGGLWRVIRLGIENTDAIARLLDMYLATRTIVESTYITNDTTSEPAIVNAPQPSGGGWANTAANNPYATVIGDSLNFSFTGTGFDIVTYGDNRGGIFEVIVDGTLVTTYSCWFTSAGYNYIRTNVVRGLAQGLHTVQLRYAGADPLNPPTGGVARGWISRSILATPTGADLRLYGVLRVTDLRDTFAVAHQLWSTESNAEVAIQARPVGEVAAAQFWPRHAVAQVNTQDATRMQVDGVVLDTTALSATWSNGVEVICRQAQRGFHTAQAGSPWIQCASEHVINRAGVSYRMRLQLLRDVESVAAYAAMVPADNTDRVLYDDGTSVDLSSHDGVMRAAPRQVSSGRFDDPVRHSYCVAFELSDPWRGLRLGRAGSEVQWNRVMPRNDAGRVRPAKLYPYLAAAPSNMSAGEVVEVSARITGGFVA
jgi:hypothetical protein